MRRFNTIFALAMLCFLVSAAGLLLLWQRQTPQEDRQYLVEVNRIRSGMEKEGSFSMPDLHDMKYVTDVLFLPLAKIGNEESIRNFYRKKNGMERWTEPYYVKGELKGFLRFDYHRPEEGEELLHLAMAILFMAAILVAAVFFYVKINILKPFQKLSDMPYELAEGRLHGELEESKSRYFGRFVWGISMLGDHLAVSRARELKLEKDKKLLLLSLSHDIRTPLNTIRLYARAMEEGIYDSVQANQCAAGKIGVLCGEIDGFVSEIVKSSSEDILHMEVENSEFYLQKLVQLIREYFASKCKLQMVDLSIGPYENKLLKGDLARAFETVENLMENALKYGDGRQISIRFYEEEYCQLIAVHNTGVSVEEKEMPHLFDSFYRGSNIGSREGNGLGLYICREIMRKMEGDIFAQREKDGMCFTLVFRT